MTGPVPLPLVPDPASQTLRISPTDVSQFVRLEQCERYLRFRLAERSGRTFMREYDVTPQRITPLLSLSGREFEESVERKVAPIESRSTMPPFYRLRCQAREKQPQRRRRPPPPARCP